MPVRAHGLRDQGQGRVPLRRREEVFEAGDAYYVGPGHTPVLYAGTEVVEFSPTEELGHTMEVVTKNMEEMEAAASYQSPGRPVQGARANKHQRSRRESRHRPRAELQPAHEVQVDTLR